MPLKTLIFDFDGTLADTLPLCIESLQSLATEFNGTRPSIDEVKSHFGLSDLGVIAGLLQIPLDPPILNDAYCRFLEIYKQLHSQLAPVPIAGIHQALTELKELGLSLTIISGRGSESGILSLKYFKLDEFFDYKAWGNPHQFSKAQMIETLLSNYSLAKEEVIYVGDAAMDIVACKEAGIPIINAAWSPVCHDDEASCLALSPEYRLSDIKQLVPLVKTL